MNIKENNELKQKAIKILEEKENKAEALQEVVDMFVSEKNADLIAEIQKQAQKANVDQEYAKTLGLRTLSEEETKFYEKFRDLKQAVTGDQINFIPNSIIDLSLENVKAEEPVLKLINFAPADVKRWVVAEKSGTFSWEGLTDELKGELSANIKGLITDLGKLDVFLIIPKAISDLALPFVDKYFTAIVEETLREGLASGYLVGTGKEQPIGIYKQIDATEEDGTKKDKEVSTDLTGFSPKQLASAKKYLTNNGKRVLDKLYLICNPADEADYVAPALYNKRGDSISSFKNIEVIQCTENPQGKAALTLAGKYTMGMNGYQITKYDQTLATDDADLLIGKVYANGRATADNVAFVFDVTKLEEYIETVKTIVEEEVSA